jgi:hypothetical protein
MIRQKAAASDRPDPLPAEPPETASAGQASAYPARHERSEPRSDRQTALGGDDVTDPGQNGTVHLARLAWLVTVVACLVTIAILTLEGYYGYALVTLAVAVSAGINLT